MDASLVIWLIAGVGLLLMFAVSVWAREPIEPHQTPTYRELQAIAYQYRLSPGYHALHSRYGQFNVLVGERYRVLPDPQCGKYWR